MNQIKRVLIIALCTAYLICMMGPQNGFAQITTLHSPTSRTNGSESFSSVPPSQEFCKRKMSHARAGNPLSLSRLAALTYNDKYQGYFMGGGVPSGLSKNRGESRNYDEGTWGVDYAPWYSRVASNWSHGRLYQGGTGQYQPDHKNHPFGQTFGRFFGNRDRRFSEDHQPIDQSDNAAMSNAESLNH